MSAYLLVVLLLVPAEKGPPLVSELHRELTSVSSLAACQRIADTKAAELAQQHADTVRRLRAQVVGRCMPVNP